MSYTPERDALKLIVSRFSETADKKPALPGETLYLMSQHVTKPEMMTLLVPMATKYCWYSTEAAALAAREAGS